MASPQPPGELPWVVELKQQVQETRYFIPESSRPRERCRQRFAHKAPESAVSAATGPRRPAPSAHPGKRRADAPAVRAAGSLLWDSPLFMIFFPLEIYALVMFCLIPEMHYFAEHTARGWSRPQREFWAAERSQAGIKTDKLPDVNLGPVQQGQLWAGLVASTF